MSSARKVSATTSLPKPGALTPAWAGRSIAPIVGSAVDLPVGRALFGGDGDIGGLFSLCGGYRGDRTGSGALAQAGQELDAGVTVGRLDAGPALIVAHRQCGAKPDP